MASWKSYVNKSLQRLQQLSLHADFVPKAIAALLAAIWAVFAIMLVSSTLYRIIMFVAAIVWIVIAYIVFSKNDRKRVENQDQGAVVQAILGSEAMPVVILNQNYDIIDANESAKYIIGDKFESAEGDTMFYKLDSASKQAIVQLLEKAAESGVSTTQTMTVTHGSGFPLELQVICSPVTKEGKIQGAAVFMQDISDRKRNVERIRYMAYYDDMTGLPNRALFQIRLGELLAAAREDDALLGICYLDLDRFKLVNGSFGREFGDMLLLQVAERLHRELSEHHFIARMEGDEFAVIFTRIESELSLMEKARRILRTIEEPYELKGFPLRITASIGAVSSMAVEDDAYMLFKKADMALAKVKEAGMNGCMLYSEAWGNSSLEHLTLQHELYHAIEREEFILHYQPQYDLNSGNIVGIEALIRWVHPERGLLSPGEFIPFSEESGMIMPIGSWVLYEACRQNKLWQDMGLVKIPISVNLSIKQFFQDDLVEQIVEVLKRTGLEPKYLNLEITESMTTDLGHISRCLLALTSLGVGISVDDFGTGYSSFHYLKNFPIDRLKIDRSFVRDIKQDQNDAEIVAAIIAMAHNLNIQVIAEGVETEEQIEFLKQHNCDEIQGYFHSPPVCRDSIEQMLLP